VAVSALKKPRKPKIEPPASLKAPGGLALELATEADVAEIVKLKDTTSARLTKEFGPGHWTGCATERGTLFDMRTGKFYVARRRGRIVAMLKLATKKPWAIDAAYFHASAKPLYLTSMAVAVSAQRTGLGRAALVTAEAIARAWGADAIRLDAYDAKAGAGPFYAKCGYTEVGRVVYKGNPLIYYERLL
jgi:GNAT superfamily N-acetyltransferase